MIKSTISTIKEAVVPEQRTTKRLGEKIENFTTSLSGSATEIENDLYDHPHVDFFLREQQRLERATNSLRVGLETMKQAEKPERGGKLKTLKNGVKLVEKETVTHVDTVHTSSRIHGKQREQALREERSSTNNGTLWHPVHNWNTELIDAINAMGPCSATLVKK